MKFYKLISLLLVTFGGLQLSGQTIQLPAKGTSLSALNIDIFGNIYITLGSQLLKYDSDGKSIYQFGQNGYGNITTIDSKNPHKTLLLYAEPNLIFIIDKNGSPMGKPIDLRRAGLYNVASASLASDGSIWILDNDSQTFVQLSQSGSIVFRSTNFEKYILAVQGSAVQMVLTPKHLLLLTETTIGVFSPEGAFVKNIHLQDQTSVLTVAKETLYLIEKGTIVAMNIETSNMKTIRPTNKEHFIYCDQNQYFVQEGESIIKYQTK